MAGGKGLGLGKSRRKGKKKKPLSHIGSALFPRAMFAAVPRSPEPSPEPPVERPPSALSSALLNASLIGRVIATPPPDATLRSKGGGAVSARSLGREGGASTSMENSMARSSMYDDGDSEEDDNEEDQNYDEPGYSTVPAVIASRQQRGTISNRAKLATPAHSDLDSVLSSDEDDYNLADVRPTDGQREQIDPSPRERLRHELDRSGLERSGEVNGTEDWDGPHLSEEKPRRPKGRRKKEGLSAEMENTKDMYSKVKKTPEPKKHRPADHSESSSLTMVTSPHEDDFSDLITPPPPWKRKGKKGAKKKVSRKTPDRLTEEEARSDRNLRFDADESPDGPVRELIVERIEATTVSASQGAAPPIPAPRSSSRLSQDDSETYNHTQHPSKVLQEVEYLRQTNSRLERELEMKDQQQDQLLGTLQRQRHQQSLPIRGTSGTDMGLVQDNTPKQLGDLHQLCENLRLENEAIKGVNDHLHLENTNLRSLSESMKDADHSQQFQIRQQAEEVIDENEQLKTIIHKLNIHLSRYQAKYSPPQKGDPPGLPSRGKIPRKLTDPKYLSPLIVAYEKSLKEKDEQMRLTQGDLNRLRKSAEEVIHENQRLHLKLDQVGSPSSVTPTEWHRFQEHARVVFEENQLIQGQLDNSQRKQKDMQKAHSLEISKMSKCLAIEESEKSDLEAQLSELKHRYSALKQRHDQSIVVAETKMPIQEHMSTVAEYKRSLEDEQHTHRAEMDNVLLKLSSVQSEKKTLAIKVADGEAEESQMQGEIKALARVQKKLQHKIVLLQKELEHSENKLALSNQHLNSVLEIAEQTAAERDSLTQVAKSQEHEKKKALNKMLAGNIAIGRLEEKLKSYRQKADHKLGNMSSRIEAQDDSHASQLREYEREMAHLKTIVQEKQDSLDTLTLEKRNLEDQLETVWQTATSDNRRIKAKLQKSLRAPYRENGDAFGYESDNRGLISSQSD